MSRLHIYGNPRSLREIDTDRCWVWFSGWSERSKQSVCPTW